MIGFVRGIIHAFGNDFVLIDVSGVGYRINFYHPESLTVGKEIIIYTYQNVREDEISLYGFLSLEEYDLFVKLISVKGLGPKTASNILAIASPAKLIDAIEMGDVDYIRKMPGVGAKTASQIILDLKNKLVEASTLIDNAKIKEAISALKALGYKPGEINPVMAKLKDQDLDVNDYVRKALGMLVKR